MVVDVEAIPFILAAVIAVVGQAAAIFVSWRFDAEMSSAYAERLMVYVDGALVEMTIADVVSDSLLQSNLSLRFSRDIDAVTAVVSAASIGVGIALLLSGGWAIVVAAVLGVAGLGAFIWLLSIDLALYDRFVWKGFSAVTAVVLALNSAAALVVLLIALLTGDGAHPVGTPSP